MLSLVRTRSWLLISGLVVAVLLLGGAVAVPRILERAATPPQPDGPPGGWRSIVDDEFGGSALNASWWQPNRYGKNGGDAPFNPDEEAAWFGQDNVAVSDGVLTLTLRSRPRILYDTRYPYSSGMVQTPADATFGPGTYVEARIEVPRCDGCWPAFWLDPSEGSPPEIDGFEFFDTGKPSESRPSFTYHPPDNSSQIGPGVYGEPGVDYRGTFHTYGILWTDSEIVPYLDGVAYPDVGVTSNIAKGKLAIIINLSVLNGHHPAEGSQLRVDWVRVWSQS